MKAISSPVTIAPQAQFVTMTNLPKATYERERNEVTPKKYRVSLIIHFLNFAPRNKDKAFPT
jgi:hypothetical protein